MRRRGFSLIEMLVAFAMAAVVISVTLGILAQMAFERSVASARQELVREAAWASQIITRDLRQTGLGVTLGAGAGGLNDHYSAVVLCNADAVGIVADLPLPHAQYPTFGPMHDRDPGDRAHIQWHNENNGNCVRDEQNTNCSQSDTSVFFAGMGGTQCDGTNVGSRYCPWSMKRLNPGEYFQIVAADGDWTAGQVASSLSMTQLPTGTPVGYYLDLAGNYNGFAGGTGGRPYDIEGLAWVTTVDRVFYRYDGGSQLQRMQCWGTPDPNATAWNAANNTTVPANAAAAEAGIVAGTGQCTAWETLLTDVISASFTAYDAIGNTVSCNSAANKASVVRLEFAVDLQRMIRSRAARHHLRGSAVIRSVL